MKLTKLNFGTKYEENVRVVEISEITIDPEFRKLQRPCSKGKRRVRESIFRDGYHKNHPVILAWIDGKLVLIDGHRRYDGAIAAGLTVIYGIVRVYQSRAEALRAAAWEQLNRRNIGLSDILYKLCNWLLKREAHRPRSVPIGIDLGDDSDSAELGLLTIEEMEEATGKSKGTLNRYLRLIRIDKNGHMERANSGDLSHEGALQLIRADINGPPKPRKLPGEKALKILLPDPSEYEAWINHCGGATEACQVLHQLACQAMEKSPDTVAMVQKEINPSEIRPSSGGGPNSCPVSPSINPPATSKTPSTTKAAVKKAPQRKSTATGERGETNYGWPLTALADTLQQVYVDKIPLVEVAKGLSTPSQRVTKIAVQRKLERVLKPHRSKHGARLTDAEMKRLIARIRLQAAKEVKKASLLEIA
jgi:hypothetical protein